MPEEKNAFDELGTLAAAAHAADGTVGSVTVRLKGTDGIDRLGVEMFRAGLGETGLASIYKLNGRPVTRRAAELLLIAYGFDQVAT